jgi:hypothetical protein
MLSDEGKGHKSRHTVMAAEQDKLLTRKGIRRREGASRHGEKAESRRDQTMSTSASPLHNAFMRQTYHRHFCTSALPPSNCICGEMREANALCCKIAHRFPLPHIPRSCTADFTPRHLTTPRFAPRRSQCHLSPCQTSGPL